MLKRKNRSEKSKNSRVTYTPVCENAPKKQEVRLIRSQDSVSGVLKIVYPDTHSSEQHLSGSEAGAETRVREFYTRLIDAYMQGIKKLAEDTLREPGIIKLEISLSPSLSEGGLSLMVRRTEVFSVGRERRVSEKTDLFDMRLGRLKG